MEKKNNVFILYKIEKHSIDMVYFYSETKAEKEHYITVSSKDNIFQISVSYYFYT